MCALLIHRFTDLSVFLFFVVTFLLLSSSSSALTVMTTTQKSIKYIDKLALILIQNRRQLVARTKDKSAFFTPGGKREYGESDEMALCREIKEELTIDLHKSSIRPYGVFEAQAFGKPDGTNVRITSYTCANFEGTIQPSNEIDELEWITSDFSKDKLTLTGIMILDDLKEKGLID